MRMSNALRHFVLGIGSILLGCAVLGGCSSQPKLEHSGFLSDYSKLESVSSSRMRYEASSASAYRSFIVEPAKSMVGTNHLSQTDQREALQYLTDRVLASIRDAGYGVANSEGPGVARVRVALTDVADSSWWQKIHPVSRAAGAGTGGAAMEAEVLDSVTGEQIAAVIQTDPGNQVNLSSFSTLADVKSAIDKWAERFAERLRELHR